MLLSILSGDELRESLGLELVAIKLTRLSFVRQINFLCQRDILHIDIVIILSPALPFSFHLHLIMQNVK